MSSDQVPRVFISYSWESEGHKAWVRFLAEQLRGYRIDARLDQWYVKTGDSFTQFMELEVEAADYVIAVCTPVFASKSNARSGGVGYEQQIVTAKVVKGAERSKFLPILRLGELDGENCAIPTHFLGTAVIDFRDESKFEQSIEELLRTIYKKPKFGPPPMGEAPKFTTLTGTNYSSSGERNLVENELPVPADKIAVSSIKTPLGPDASNVIQLSPQTKQSSPKPTLKTKKGTVIRFDLKRAYGFIKPRNRGKEIFVHRNNIADDQPLFKGQEVEYTVEKTDKGPAAINVVLLSDRNLPSSGNLFDWAEFGNISTSLDYLAAVARDEDWTYTGAPSDPSHPLPILYNYFKYTFERLVLESKTQKNKIMISLNGLYATFNTGLVNNRYQPLYALFTKNKDWGQPWKIKDFCVYGARGSGAIVTEHFSPPPLPAHYFNNPASLIYDTREGVPVLSSEHIIVDNIDRFPPEFIESHCPESFTLKDISKMKDNAKKEYYEELGRHIKNDDRIFRKIENRLHDAVKLALLRVGWNYRTAIPQYHPQSQELQLLLPLSLVSDDRVDLALAVARKASGAYLGYTVLPLDWAYRNARLIFRLDSDWLTPSAILAQSDDSEDIK